jgi:hypothetical protein
MRDSARIDQVLSAVRRVWSQNPDFRLGQLIVNAVRPEEPCPEIFYIEDGELVRRLMRMAEEWQQARRGEES